MTSDQQRHFEQQWPGLALRLSHLLARKRVSPWLIEDIVQETGLRLIRMWDDIDQARPLWPLTATIALNLLRDDIRKGSSSELAGVLPEAPSRENVEERGLARLHLRAVGGALAQLPATQRQIILDEVATRPSGVADASATRMLRMRARQRLQRLVDQVSVLGVTVALQLRRLVREAELFIGRILPSHAEGASAVAIGLLAAVSIGIVVAPQAPSEAAEPPPRTSAAPATSSRVFDVDAASKAGLMRHRRDAAPVLSRAQLGAPAERRRRAGGRGDSTTGSGTVLPGTVEYRIDVTDDTYVNGQVQAEVVGTAAKSADERRSYGPGQLDCTVTHGYVGASCTYSGGGLSERRARAEHRGEA